MKEMIKVEENTLNSVIFLMFLSQKRENNMAKHKNIEAFSFFFSFIFEISNNL